MDPNDPSIGDSKTFTNVGGVKRSPDGKYWGEADESVEVSSYGVFKNAVLKYDDIISYTVEIRLPDDAVNDDSLKSATMEDRITEKVELIVSSVKVADLDGKEKAEGKDYTYGYDSASRMLTVTLYDKNPCKVSYDVRVVDTDRNNQQEISNTVKVTAKKEYTDTVKGEYRIVNHSASMSALQPEKIIIRKQDQKGEALSGAEFSLEKWNEEEGKWEAVAGSPFMTGDDGTVEIRDLWTDPKPRTYSATYRYWESKAPDGYEITDKSKHYFILYEKEKDNEAESHAAANAEAERRSKLRGIDAAVEAIPGGYTITVTDKKLLGSLTITKTVVGNGADVEAKEFTFTITGPDGSERTATLKDGESVTIDNLEPGAYTVKEDETSAAIEGYGLKVTSEGTTVIEVKEGKVQNASIIVTNTYEPTPEESTTPESTTPETTPESTTPATTPESTTPETTPESTTPGTTSEIVPEEGGSVLGERIAQIVQDLKEGVLGERRGVLGVHTGDDAPIIGLSLAVLAAGAAIVLLAKKKKREK